MYRPLIHRNTHIQPDGAARCFHPCKNRIMIIRVVYGLGTLTTCNIITFGPLTLLIRDGLRISRKVLFQLQKTSKTLHILHVMFSLFVKFEGLLQLGKGS